MAEAVEIVIENFSYGLYDVGDQVKAFYESGGEIMASKTSLEDRSMRENDVCHISTMIECIGLVE